ncbi:SDH family Clp fold serine proteinase [Leifsonia poae]|uniref:SDH family Clp fold serine proteinase n=1 Tax=Leifsonia poae TaxID=110933 RepID=UPI003D68F4B9
MPTWGDLLQQLTDGSWTAPDGSLDLDRFRRHYVEQLSNYTGRNTVVYSTDWLNPAKSDSPDLSILLGDMQGLMEVFKDLDVSAGLDLVLHSPGGDPTAADSLVRYMRSRFAHVRVIVPVAAMSAATMWSLAADELILGRHSQLGPIDPQLRLGNNMIPAAAIKRNFEKAQSECAADPSRLSAWVPVLQQYYPGLLEMCDDFTNLSKALVEEYLLDYMLRRRKNKAVLAKAAAEFFADSDAHMAHSRGIGRDKIRAYGLKVSNLEDDAGLQDAVLTVHHAMTHTFNITSIAKIVENQLGRSWMKAMPAGI